MIKSRVLWAVGIAGIVCGIAVTAQTPASPTFEVASIKPNKSGEPERLGLFAPGRFIATNVTVQALVAAAYGFPVPLPASRISGGPDWMDTDRFDIAAGSAHSYARRRSRKRGERISRLDGCAP
jgi:hypothetical protein